MNSFFLKFVFEAGDQRFTFSVNRMNQFRDFRTFRNMIPKYACCVCLKLMYWEDVYLVPVFCDVDLLPCVL